MRGGDWEIRRDFAKCKLAIAFLQADGEGQKGVQHVNWHW